MFLMRNRAQHVSFGDLPKPICANRRNFQFMHKMPK